MIEFSAISAEERESAITQDHVDQAAQKLTTERTLDITSFR
jgi:hypothetical protein